MTNKKRSILCMHAVAFFCLGLCAEAAAATTEENVANPSDENQILVLVGAHYGLPMVDAITAAFVNALTAEGFSLNDIFVEFLDLHRNTGLQYRSDVLAMLEQKLRNKQVDFIMAVNQAAVDFVAREGKDLFPHAPVLIPILEDFPSWEGPVRQQILLSSRVDAKGTLGYALDLFPNTKRVLLIMGRDDHAAPFLDPILKALDERPNKLKIERTADLPYEEMLGRIATLPPDTIAFYGSYFHDITGRSFIPAEVAAQVAATANVPVFAFRDLHIVQGLVGGSVTITSELGRQAAQIALDYMEGGVHLTQPATFFEVPNVPLFDWGQVRRWGGNTRALPDATVYLNRPASLWDQHTDAVVVAVVGSTVLLILALVLLVQNKKQRIAIVDLRRMEEALWTSEQRYRWLFERAPIGIGLTEPGGRVVIANEAMAELFGYSPEELKHRNVSDLYADPNDRAALLTCVQRDGWASNYPARMRRKDGRRLDILLSVSLIQSESNSLLQTIYVDVTKQKQVEQALKFSHDCLELAGRCHEQEALLEGFVAKIQAFTGCEGVGIRLLDEAGNIPYEAYVGFDPAFYESESPLSIKTDQCMCINVITGETDPALPFYTKHGSFYMNGTTRFLATVPEADKGRRRNVCNETGFESVGLVPIRVEGRIMGLIHVADARENMAPRSVIEALETVGAELGAALKRIEAERMLCRSEQRYRAITEQCVEMLYLHDLDGNFIEVNQAAVAGTGYAKEELLRMSVFDLHGAEPQCEKDEIRNQWKAWPVGQCLTLTWKHRRKDGSRFPVEIRTRKIVCGGDEYILALVQDVTERRQAEEKLRESERTLSNALHMARLGYWELDVASGIFTFTDSFYAIFGVNAEQMGGYKMSIDDYASRFVHPQDRHYVGDETRNALMTDDPDFSRYIEHRILHADGSTGIIAVKYFIRKDSSGKTIKTYGVNQDITERKRAEEALERHHVELQAIYDYAPVMMCLLDDDRRVLYANRAFTQFTGICENDLKDGRACGAFGCINAQDDPRGCGFGPACEGCDLLRALNDTLKTGAGHRNIEYRATLEHTTGRRDVVLLGATAAIRTGNQTNVLLCLEDRTEQEQAEQRLRQREEELLHAARLSTLGEMASGLAHELSQPLAAIVNYGTACKKLASASRPDMVRIAENLGKITQQAERARDIMIRIREFARRRLPRAGSVDMNEVTGRVLELLSWQIRRSGVQVTLELDERHSVVQADVIQLEQVVLNLTRNAVEAMEQVPPEERRLTIRTGAHDGGTVRIEVGDTGAGIGDGAFEHIFDAFFTTKADGLGLGLSISRSIVEMHGGTLQARRNESGGSTFVVVLPKTTAQAEAQSPRLSE